MKILSLSFQNINSLKGEHHIDFTGEAFAQNPLFAITGPTGSGKTTILDVISLALFNEVPRLGKISNTEIEEKGAILTRNQEEAFAEVQYECARGEYVSTWSISTNRNGNLRPYEMELFRVHPLKESLDLKKSQVPAENEALIGLSYSQFIKSVLLAQGEFAKFLKAGNKERSQLLEQITGTGIYRQLGIRAFRKYSDENKAIEQEEHYLESLKDDLLSEEKVKELTGEKKRLTTSVIAAEKKADRLKLEVNLQKEILKLNEQITSKNKGLAEAKKRQETFLNTHGERLKTHEAIQEFATDIQAYDQQHKQLEEQKKEVAKLSKQHEREKEARQEKKREIAAFVGEDLADKEPMNVLNDFFEKVNGLQKARETLKSEYQGKKGLFEREIEGLSDKVSGKEILKDQSKWERLKANIQIDKTALLEKLSSKTPADFDQAIQDIETTVETLRTAKNDQREIERLGKEITKAKKERKGISENRQGLPEKIKTLSLQTNNEELKLKNLRQQRENQLMRAELDDLRKQLKPGGACPLCGATEHPYATELPEESDLSKQIDQQEKSFKECQQKLTRLQSKQETLAERQEKLDNELSAKKSEEEKLSQRFSDTYVTEITAQLEDYEAAVARQKQRLKHLKQLQTLQEKEDSIKKADPILAELTSIIRKGKEIKEEIEGHYRGKNLQKDVRKLENTWQDIRKNLGFTAGRLKELKPKLAENRKALGEIETDLQPKLKVQGFAKITEAKAALIAPERYKKLIDQKAAIEKQMTTYEAEIETLKVQEKNQREKLDGPLNIEELTHKKEQQEKELVELKRQLDEYNRRLTNNKELWEKYQKLQKKIKEQQEQNRRWKQLSDLIGDAKGDRFNQFAQDLTLRHLLKLANQRLKGLTERYRLTINPQHKDGLEVVDLDMGGQHRSVRTLSGGESFLMSLSLALALSDLASKNITINSLFIDEGFGTLDPETLDQTLDTLERLQAASSKTIGIISHVESLKERIGTQIQLSRDGRGYSKLTLKSF